MDSNQDIQMEMPFPIIDLEALEKASPDGYRVRAEVAKWEADPETYISDNFNKIADWDFPVYSAANLNITDKVGRSIKLLWNNPQRQLWRWFIEDLAAGRPIRWYIVKARQMGISTWILALFYWLTSLRSNRNALSVAQDEDAYMGFNSRVRTMYASSNGLLKPRLLTDKKDLIHFGNNTTQRKNGDGPGLDSQLAFMVAGKGELGRSHFFHYVHLSEIGLWPELKISIKDTLIAVQNSVALMPGTVIIRETTAKGENEAKTLWDDPEDGYRKIFVPWVAMDNYRAILEPGEALELCAEEELGGQQTRYGNEQIEARLIREALITWWPRQAASEQWLEAEIPSRLKWRRRMIDQNCAGDKLRFRQEYPTIAEHAFTSTSRLCFDQQSIELMRQAVEEEALDPARCVYVEDPDVDDPNRKFREDEYGKVYFYKLPEQGKQYVIGGDPSLGLSASSDPSALVVLEVPDLEEVCSFNGIIAPDLFAEMAYYLGKLYNNALIGIENNERGGYAALTLLSKVLKYPRLFHDRDLYTGKRSDKPGFVTTAANKSKMVSDLAQLIRDHQVLFRSPVLLDPLRGQFAHYRENPDGTLGAPKKGGYHDDYVSAVLIAVYLAGKVHQFPPAPTAIPKGSFAEAAEQIRRRKRLPQIGTYK